MLANKYNISIWQGSTFTLSITVQDSAGLNLNLSTFDARMQIRSSYDSGTIAESLTTSNGEIVITGSTGKLDLELPATRTANLFVDLSSESKPPKSIYVYDLELIDNSTNTVTKLMFGDAIVYGEVTR
jgi:hypothetical protein